MKGPRAPHILTIAQPAQWRPTLVIALAVLVGVCTAALVESVLFERQAWTPLHAPPERAVTILAYAYPDLFVGTTTSTIYACRDDMRVAVWIAVC